MSAATTGTTALPAYFVKGEDPVVVGDAVRTLVDELVGDDDAALTVEDFSSDDYELAAVVDAAQTPPFFTDATRGRGAGARSLRRRGAGAAARLSRRSPAVHRARARSPRAAPCRRRCPTR